MHATISEFDMWYYHRWLIGIDFIDCITHIIYFEVDNIAIHTRRCIWYLLCCYTEGDWCRLLFFLWSYNCVSTSSLFASLRFIYTILKEKKLWLTYSSTAATCISYSFLMHAIDKTNIKKKRGVGSLQTKKDTATT